MAPRKRPECERFWEKVDKNGPVLVPELGNCWTWTKRRDKDGYGQFSVYRPEKRRSVAERAHRVAWRMKHGTINPKMDILHRCDNPPCVRDDHLFEGTVFENNRDRSDKGRSATGDRNGSRTRPDRLRRGDNHPSRLHPESRPRGERHARALLTDRQADEIRTRRGTSTQKQLAAEYGVSVSLVQKIQLGIVRRPLGKHCASVVESGY